MALTKSLHTVTAVANVARYVYTNNYYSGITPETLAAKSLAILGYTMSDYASDDPTIVKIVRECRIMVYAQASKRYAA